MSDFFRDVTLPANNQVVTIRRVDVGAISQAATLVVLAEGAQVDLSDDMVDTLQRLGQSEQLTPALLRSLLAAADEVNRRLVVEAVTDLDGLLLAYRAKGTERDFGLGPDFAVLVTAIREHSGVPEVPMQTPLQALAGTLQPSGGGAPAPKRRAKKS